MQKWLESLTHKKRTLFVFYRAIMVAFVVAALLAAIYVARVLYIGENGLFLKPSWDHDIVAEYLVQNTRKDSGNSSNAAVEPLEQHVSNNTQDNNHSNDYPPDDVLTPIKLVIPMSIGSELQDFVFVVEGAERKHYMSDNSDNKKVLVWETNVISKITISSEKLNYTQELTGFTTDNTESRDNNYGLSFNDWNFDGYLDISLRAFSGGSMGNYPTYYWLWNNNLNQYEANAELEELSDYHGVWLSGTENLISCYQQFGFAWNEVSYYGYEDGHYILKSAIVSETESVQLGSDKHLLHEVQKRVCDDGEEILGESYYVSSSSNESPFDSMTRNNPIDAYFLPVIGAASSETERREHQDTYRGVWKAEFESIIRWIGEKCTTKQDTEMLNAYVASVEQHVAATRFLVLSDVRVNTGLVSNTPDADVYGNDTRSWINQLEGEIYRDAGMRLVGNVLFSDRYTFTIIDYTLEHYE